MHKRQFWQVIILTVLIISCSAVSAWPAQIKTAQRNQWTIDPNDSDAVKELKQKGRVMQAFMNYATATSNMSAPAREASLLSSLMKVELEDRGYQPQRQQLENQWLSPLSSVPGHVFSSGHIYGHKPEYAVSEVPNQYWVTSFDYDAAGRQKAWIGYSFDDPQTIVAYRLKGNPTMSPTGFQFEAYDGKRWLTLHRMFECKSVNLTEWAVFQINNTRAYRFYRLYITRARAYPMTGLYQFEMMARHVVSSVSPDGPQ